MRKLLILSLCVLIFGCGRKDNPTIKIVGFLKNSEIAIAELKTIDSTYIDTIINGRFSFNVKADNYIDLKLGEWIPLFAEFGDSIFIDYESSKRIQFSGFGFEESEFLYKKRNLMMELGLEDPRKIDIALFSSKPEQFIETIDSVKQIRIKQLNDYRKLKPQISNSFYNTEILLINYFWINQQFGYPGFNEMLTNIKPELPDNYYKFADLIETNNEELFKFDDYKSTLRSYLDFRAKELKDKYTLAKEIFTESEIFEDIMFREINSQINFNGIDGIDSICDDFLAIIKDKGRKDYLTEKYNNWSNLAKGKKAPEFEILDDNGNMVRLSDFLGKFVYIDCWSSFCGPCIREMPEMKKLSDELKNENIIFVSISADSDKEKWLSKIKEFELNTINLCTEGATHKFNNDYNAKAFPRYIFIDDKGFIIDATAEKPSVIKEKLKQLL